MIKTNESKIGRRFSAAVAVICGVVPVFSLATQVKADQISVNITQLTAADKIDALSAPDFLARVTIAGEVFQTNAVKNQSAVRPNWTIRKIVSSGVHDVKIEILDKDVTKSEPIDVNRVDNKRDLDFTVDTRTCVISGFADPIRCGTEIRREGQEVKKAEIVFYVEVSRD